MLPAGSLGEFFGRNLCHSPYYIQPHQATDIDPPNALPPLIPDRAFVARRHSPSRPSPPYPGNSVAGVDSLPRHGERLAVVLPPEPQQERDGGLGPLRRTQVVAGLLAEGAAEHRGVDDARVEGDGGQALREFLGQGAASDPRSPISKHSTGRPRARRNGPSTS